MSLHHIIRKKMPLIGTFIKTPHHAIVEALGSSGLDFLILDSEHAPFGVAEIDCCVLAARAISKPVLVRLADDRPAGILQVLDLGADGVLVPHVTSATQAESIVRSTRYKENGRGYSATNRAGNYGQRTMSAHLESSADPVVVVQIEDPIALQNIDEIAQVEGISALFVGPADLAVSYSVVDLKAEQVQDALDKVIAAGQRAGVPVATFCPGMAEAQALFARGISMLAIASEHKPMQDFFSVLSLDVVRPKD